MRKLIFDNVTLFYVVGYLGSLGYYTDFFFEPTIVKTRRKYFFFGPTITYRIQNNKPIFTLNDDIEALYYSKDEVRVLLKKELEIIKRKEEILRGEIV